MRDKYNQKKDNTIFITDINKFANNFNSDPLLFTWQHNELNTEHPL